VDIDNAEPIDSPARRMQRTIESAWVQTEAPRWSRRRRFAFIVGSSILLWAGLIWCVSHLV